MLKKIFAEKNLVRKRADPETMLKESCYIFMTACKLTLLE